MKDSFKNASAKIGHIIKIVMLHGISLTYVQQCYLVCFT